MKQFAFTLLATLFGVTGSFALSPVYGLAVYYLFAVLRPQSFWDWADFLGYRITDFQWSFYVAVATLVSTAGWRLGVFTPSRLAAPPWYGEPRYTRSHYLFLAFTAWICLTYVTAVKPHVAWPFFVEYVKIFVMFICATLVLRSVESLKVIYYVVLGAAVYIAYECNAYYVFDHTLLFVNRGHGGLDNNGGALILAMGVPMCFFAWEATGHWVRWAFLAVIPVLIHAVLLTYSRGAMLSLALTAVLMWFRARDKRFVSVLYAVGVVLVLIMAGKEIRERFLSIERHEADSSAQSRTTTWKIAIQMANERPVFGFGIRNSNEFTFQYGADMQGRSIHSQYLQTAADSGWVGLGLYVLLLGSVFLGLWSVRRATWKWNDPETARVRSMASGLECALVLFCIGAVFLSLEHFEMPYILMLLSVQLHAITRAILARLEPARPGSPGYAGSVCPHPYPTGAVAAPVHPAPEPS